MHGVEITELVEKFQLKNMTPDIDTDKIVLTHPEVNRPALQLAGFFDHFDNERVQIIGNVELAYISAMEHDVKLKRYEQLVSSKIPCPAVQPGNHAGRGCDHGLQLLRSALPGFREDHLRPDVRGDPLAEGEAGPHDQHSRGSGGCVRRGRADYGRERHRKERGGAGAHQARTPAGDRRRGGDPQKSATTPWWEAPPTSPSISSSCGAWASSM